jgi:putative ABC transport system permease protein
MSRWRPALRIARRTVLRSPARSALIALLVALPVAGATSIDLLVRTMTSPEHRAEREIGPADAVVADISAERLSAYLPPGTRLAANPFQVRIALDRGSRTKLTTLVAADAREPLHGHLVRVAEGRAPRGEREVLVTRSLARRMNLLDDGRLRAHATITMRRGRAATVTGLARAPFCLSCEQIVASPGSQFARIARSRGQGAVAVFIEALAPSNGSEQALLLDLPQGARTDRLAATLDARAGRLVTRDQVAHPDFRTTIIDDSTLRAAALTAVAVALGLLEIVLLAGTALAVGARRQVRELGLVAASGGSASDVRRIVLAQGLVLGVLGAAAGVLGGAALALAARALAERFYNEQLTGWAVGPWEVAGAALVGLLSGLAAAIVPAIGAGRMKPVDALAGRFRTARTRRRRNVGVGAALIGAGVLSGIGGDRLLDDEFRAYAEQVAASAGRGVFVDPPSSDLSLVLVIGGGTLAVVGLVLLAPVLIGYVARFGARLPLSARLAVRDAERHRHRTGPAAGAITIAVAGAVFAAFIVAMLFHAEDARIVPQLPQHVLAIEGDGGRSQPKALLTDAGDAAAAELPGGRRLDVRVARTDRRGVHLVAPAGHCSAGTPCESIVGNAQLAVVASGEGVTRVLAGGPLDGAARAAMRAGKVLVFDPVMLDDAGRVRVQAAGPRPRMFEGHVVQRQRHYTALPSAIASPALVRRAGWTARVDQVLVTYGATAQRDDIDSALAVAGDTAAAYVDDDEAPVRNAILLVVALIAGLVTLLGVAISVALSAAEGRADLATLAAVGAPPRRRRALVATQALFVGGLGGLLGTALGTFVACTARATTGSPDFVVPWWNLAAVGVGAPLVAALVAAACTRGRLPLVRRAE